MVRKSVKENTHTQLYLHAENWTFILKCDSMLMMFILVATVAASSKKDSWSLVDLLFPSHAHESNGCKFIMQYFV